MTVNQCYSKLGFLLKPLLALLAAIVFANLTGCATIIKGSSQTIPVSSTPSGADVLLDGNLFGQTPIDLEVKRKRDHLVSIEKSGYETKTIPVTKKIGGAVWGNIIAGGLIGWGVDASSGAQYNLLPTVISVKLEESTGSASSSQKDRGAEFITKLNQLDDLVENKTLSKDSYLAERCKLFKEYFPNSPPDDSCEDTNTD